MIKAFEGSRDCFGWILIVWVVSGADWVGSQYLRGLGLVEVRSDCVGELVPSQGPFGMSGWPRDRSGWTHIVWVVSGLV